MLVSGDIRCLGVMADERQASDDFKNYPTLRNKSVDLDRLARPWDQQNSGSRKNSSSVLKKIVSGESRVMTNRGPSSWTIRV